MKTRKTNYKYQNKYFVKDYDTQTSVYDRSVGQSNKTFNGVVIGDKVHTVKYHHDYGTTTSCGRDAGNSTKQKFVSCQSCVNTFRFSNQDVTKFVKDYFVDRNFKVTVRS